MNDSKTKIWFIEVGGAQKGPYSIVDLTQISNFNPDTLVWREGFTTWIPARNIPELQEVFKDKAKKKSEEENEEDEREKLKIFAKGKDEIAVDMHNDFPPWFWWVMGVLLLSYTIFKVFFEQ